MHVLVATLGIFTYYFASAIPAGAANIGVACPNVQVQLVTPAMGVLQVYKYILIHTSGVKIVAAHNDAGVPGAPLNYGMINAYFIIDNMCATQPGLCQSLGSAGHTIVLLGPGQTSAFIPDIEHAEEYPAVFMDPKPGLRNYPINIIDGLTVAKNPRGIYFPQQQLVHEFAHALKYAIDNDQSYYSTTQTANGIYNVDLQQRQDLFQGNYIRDSVHEMFAEGAMIYFNMIRPVRPEPWHNYAIYTRQQLAQALPSMFQLYESIFSGYSFPDSCVMPKIDRFS